ncbi:MAG TPA: PKD domain-containing protein, partial [Puia sp.]|nr:PKD domain-containing protein [Puia sp.]
RWFFGDGSTTVDSSWNTAHTFSQAGKYEVCLRVQSSPTCVSYQCDSVVVSTQVPVCNTKANYSWKVDSSKANTIDFTSTTTATNTAGLSVRWYFGDGSTIVDSSWNTTHTFPQAGKYFVCLRVQSSPTCVSYQCDSVVVSTQVPVCNSSLSLFTTLQSTGNSLSYYFKPTYPNSTVKYTWTFGDLTGSTNEAAQHQYAQAGNYTACLTAYRDSTCASTTCKELDVTGRSDCDSFSLSFSHYASTESAPNNIHFYAIANFPLQQEIWAITKLSNTVDSAIVLDQTNPVYLFNDTGYYNVCLKMMAPGSCAKEYCDTVHVKATATSCHLQAYPDPAHAQVSVNVPLTANGIIHAYLYNLQGVLLSQENQQGSLGNNLVTMNTQNLASGEYIIRVTYGSSICYAKFMKM